MAVDLGNTAMNEIYSRLNQLRYPCLMERLVGLDALRGIAALIVFAHHVPIPFGLEILPINGALGVDLFFVLSGFVISRTYQHRIVEGLQPLDFMRLRYRRLFVPAAIGSTIGFTLITSMLGLRLDLVMLFAATLFFMPSFINTPVWSLFVEMIANLLHATTFATASNRALTIILVVAATIFMATTYSHGTVYWGPSLGETALAIPRALTGYLIGILLFRFEDRLQRAGPPVLYVALFPIALVATTLLPQWLAAFVVVFALSPICLAGSLTMRPATWAKWLGALSYPLYATHWPVLKWVAPIGLNPAAGVILALAVAAAVTVAVEASRRTALTPRHTQKARPQQAGRGIQW